MMDDDINTAYKDLDDLAEAYGGIDYYIWGYAEGDDNDFGEEYCDIAEKRIEPWKEQTRLF